MLHFVTDFSLETITYKEFNKKKKSYIEWKKIQNCIHRGENEKKIGTTKGIYKEKQREKKNGSSQQQRVHEKWQIGLRTHQTIGGSGAAAADAPRALPHHRHTLMHSDKVPTNFQPD